MALDLESTKQTAKKVARRTLWFSLVALLIAAIGYFFYRNYNYSEGSRTGILIKVSTKGWLFKTNEGQLNLAGDGGIINQQSLFEFSATDAAARQLQALEGKKVSVHYHEKIDAFPWQGDTNYIVDEVHEAK